MRTVEEELEVSRLANRVLSSAYADLRSQLKVVEEVLRDAILSGRIVLESCPIDLGAIELDH